ncbi:alpha/beta fold hydrolase [Rhodococcus triatomae]|nr:alpha/beta hydrolase-like protein [Rhodococcus triatomae BKS 15-14]
MRAELRSTAVDVAGFRFDAQVTSAVGEPDSGAPVVLLHGFPQSKASWAPVLGALESENVPAVAFDQRGYSSGARPLDVAEYATRNLVADVLGVCDEFGFGRFHLVGHDWGAIVAWNVAARHPDRVSSLVALSVPHPASFAWAIEHDPDQREHSAYMQFFREDPNAAALMTADHGAAVRVGFGETVPPDLVAEHLRVLLQDGAMDAALNWYRAMDSMGDVPPVDVPTTFVWGTEDIAICRAGVARCREFVTGDYTLNELAGASHWIPEEDPETVLDAIRKHRSDEGGHRS